MIRTLERKAFTGNLLFCKFAGNSNDTKPTTGIVTGSTFFEVDTGVEYAFDEDSGVWVGEGSGNGKTLIYNATVTLGSSVSYDGTEKTQAVSSVVVGETTLVADTDYVVTGNKATEVGDYTLRIVGIGNYAGFCEKEWTISKGTGSVSASPSSLTLTEEGDPGESTLTVTGDGELSVESSAEAVATAELNGTKVVVTPVAEGSATVTVTLAGTDHFSGDTDTISVTVEAAADADS